jgi:hypothetical protein
MAINTGDVLMGLGAAIGGTGPQFIQGLQQREQQLSERKRAEIEARQKAMYQDAATGLQLLAQGDLDGLIALGEDRLQLLQTFPDADPSDTQRIVQNARLAKQGDPVALRNLATELSSATSRGLAMGLVKLPEAQKPVVVGAGETLVNPATKEVIYQGEEKSQTPLTDIGKLNRALATGEITQAQYDEATRAPEVNPEEKTAALNNVRSNVQKLNNNLSEIVGAYNKVMGLEPGMRAKSRGAINAAIMNVARLISPGIVTDKDAAALSGADSSVSAIFGFLNGKGVDTNQLMRIVDPTNPDTFDIDALLNVAKSVTAAGVPALQAQISDEQNVADIYGASTQFKKAYFGNSKLQNEINNIMKSVNPSRPIPQSAISEGITIEEWNAMTPQGQAEFK